MSEAVRAERAARMTGRTEWVVSLIIKVSGYSSILFVTLIFLFLMREGLPALANVSLESIFGARWYPIALGLSRTSEMIPSEEGSRSVSAAKIVLSLESPRRSTSSRK